MEKRVLLFTSVRRCKGLRNIDLQELQVLILWEQVQLDKGPEVFWKQLKKLGHKGPDDTQAT